MKKAFWITVAAGAIAISSCWFCDPLYLRIAYCLWVVVAIANQWSAMKWAGLCEDYKIMTDRLMGLADGK